MLIGSSDRKVVPQMTYNVLVGSSDRKVVPEMTYNVLIRMLNPTIEQLLHRASKGVTYVSFPVTNHLPP